MKSNQRLVFALPGMTPLVQRELKNFFSKGAHPLEIWALDFHELMNVPETCVRADDVLIFQFPQTSWDLPWDLSEEIDFRKNILKDLKTKFHRRALLSDSPLPANHLTLHSSLRRKHMQNCSELSRQLENEIEILPLDLWTMERGLEKALSAKLWLEHKFPWSLDFFHEICTQISNWLQDTSTVRKVIVLDLDNTLWGGIFSEDGAAGLKLGPPDAIGEFYFEFQKNLKTLKAQGYLLAVASKNDQSEIESFWRQRPDLPLQWQDFAATQIHWNRKSKSLQAIAQELNLGLESFVFIDDDAVECAEVRHTLPMVEVIELAKFHLDRFQQIRSLCWQRPLTREDQRRSELYGAEKQRESILMDSKLTEFGFHQQLQIKVDFQELSNGNLSRTAQLFAKTNQFNLTLRRHADTDLLKLQSQGMKIWTYSVSDRFGDYGIVGAVIFDPAASRVRDWVMSCRVLNRMVETQVLDFLCKEYGLRQVQFEFAQGPRNGWVLEKLKAAGATPIETPNIFLNFEKSEFA